MRTFRPRPKKTEKIKQKTDDGSVSPHRERRLCADLWTYLARVSWLFGQLRVLRKSDDNDIRVTILGAALTARQHANVADVAATDTHRQIDTHITYININIHIYTHIYIDIYIYIQYIYMYTLIYGACLEFRGALHPQSVSVDIQWGRPPIEFRRLRRLVDTLSAAAAPSAHW